MASSPNLVGARIIDDIALAFGRCGVV